MKAFTKNIVLPLKLNLIIIVVFTFTCYHSLAQEADEDITLSPYFLIQGDDRDTDRLPLKSTSVETNIAGVIADVTVRQVYKNEGTNTLEAIYVFPGSTRAAVYAMKMIVGERTIEAVIKERKRAREEYEQAKEEGKSASLLEQHRPNVFQMNVANIIPGDRIEVEMRYTELLIPTDRVYEFVYPTVVGPRYVSKDEYSPGNNPYWNANPYTSEGEPPSYSFNIQVQIATGLPLQDIACTSHNVNIHYSDNNSAIINLKNAGSDGGNKDFILRYRLTGKSIESGLLLYESEEENFFLAMVQPPDAIQPEQIPPREYVFIMDVSGSMHGTPLNTSKQLMKNLIAQLKSTDRFNVLLFAGGSKLFSEQSVQATSDNMNKVIEFIDEQHGGGGTELLSALKKALNLPATEKYSRTFVIATDGYVTVEKEAFDLIRENLGRANFFPFGIGSSVNRFIIEGIAHAGMGEPSIVTKFEEAGKAAMKFRKYIQNPVLTNITISFNNFDAYDVEPLKVPDVFAERPILIYGKWRGKKTGSIEIMGDMGDSKYNKSLALSSALSTKNNSALKYLWARQRIKMSDDYNRIDKQDKYEAQITSLGLKYNLLTRYTSFIAIDTKKRHETGETITVKQPLPLPEGVSNYAIGNSQVRSNKMYSLSYSAPLPKIKETSGTVNDAMEVQAEDMMKKPETADKIFYIVEEMPKFGENDEVLKDFLKSHLIYPPALLKSGITGTVIVSFIVKADGTVSNTKITRGVHPEIDKEAIRVIMLTSGKWSPGKQNGKPVDVQYTVPLQFSPS